MENLKIKIQILDEQNSVLISSTINKSTIDSVPEFHNRSVLTDVYNSMLEDLSINKMKEKNLCESSNSTLDKVESTMDSIKLASQTGRFMFKFDDDEPQECATIYDYGKVTIELQQQKEQVDGLQPPPNQIVFTSNDGKRFALFIENCQ